MKIQQIREPLQPYGTEYSCMMMLVLDGELVVIRPGTEEFEKVTEMVRSFKNYSIDGKVKTASTDDMLFFFNQVATTRKVNAQFNVGLAFPADTVSKERA